MHLSLALKLSQLGDRTHIWFPMAQPGRGSTTIQFSRDPNEIQHDRPWKNQSAYFFSDQRAMTITAHYEAGALSPVVDRPEKYDVSPNACVQSDSREIRDIATRLVENKSSVEEKARACFDWVVGYLHYDNPIRGLYTSMQALTDRRVDCGGFSTLLVALLRSLRIPARCVFGWAAVSRSGYHAWIEHYDENKKVWIPSDPSAAHLGRRTKLRAGFGFVEDPRIVVSVGEDILLEGEDIQWEVPLFQTPVVVSLRDDIPQPFEDHLE